MNSEKNACLEIITQKMQLELIDNLSQLLNVMVSPHIEKTICVVENCTGGTDKHTVVSHYMEYSIIYLDLLFLTRTFYDSSKVTVFAQIVEPFMTLRSRLNKAGYSWDPEKKVPKKYRWVVFVENIKMAHTLFQDVAQSIKHPTGSLHKYIGFIVQYIRAKIYPVYKEGYAMGSQVVDTLEKQIKAIDQLYSIMDVFTSPHIEGEMEFSLGHYAANAKNYIDILIESDDNGIQLSIIGDKELAVLQQWRKMVSDVCSHNEEGFSKKQDWLDFVKFINTSKLLLADALKRYTEKTIQDVQIFMFP